jgi:hypothetical protein
MSDSILPPQTVPSTFNDGVSISSKPLTLLAIRLLVGGLLLMAAALKIWSTADSAALAVAYDIPPLLTAVVVQTEFLLAALLLFGCWTRQALIASAFLFGGFSAFSVFRGLAGFESCGCFGSFKVNPWITAVLDLCILVAASWGAWKLASPRERIQPWRLYGAGVSYALAAVAGVVGFVAQAPTALTQGYDTIAEDGGLIVLEPEDWIGQPFPLTKHLTPEINVNKGRWILLLYHHDCPQCQQALPQYERLAANQALVGSDQSVVLIETPPFEAASLHHEGILHARLADSHEWFVQTPVEIRIEEGIVISASLDLPAVTPSALSLLP